ncbi:hypothetical protein D9619_002924 [Psilocybe cf. subviscida]|uniref:Proteasome activator PA28 C-terminal domain-containing protein n=1 Tax=Psilocybe cf. subviscida TaxID=2480587 RepID=A0A8H5EUR4_9AGAR|nr:hypothetical protein D9619_002924 [Psilocybe cf. subviscida]
MSNNAAFSSGATTVTKDLKQFKERALSQGFGALSITVPGKYQALDSVNAPLLDSARALGSQLQFTVSELDEIICRMNALSTGSLEERDCALGPRTKKRKHCDHQLDAKTIGSEPSNTSSGYAILETMNHLLKLECEALVQITDDAKLWVIFSGDCNTDSSEDLIAELHRAQASALNLRSSPQSDYLKRAKLCNDIMAYPGTPDYMSALREFDDERLFLARQRLKDLQNIYIVLAESVQQTGIVGHGLL